MTAAFDNAEDSEYYSYVNVDLGHMYMFGLKEITTRLLHAKPVPDVSRAQPTNLTIPEMRGTAWGL